MEGRDKLGRFTKDSIKENNIFFGKHHTEKSKKIMSKKRKDYRNILSEPRDFQLGFIQGFFDAEGTVHNKRYSIRVSSSKKQTIYVIKKILESFRIKTGKIHADKTAFILPIYGKENLKRFSDIINFRHRKKKNRLLGLISG